MAARTWTFVDWFDRQHGSRPSTKSTQELDADVQTAERQLRNARQMRDAVELWEQKRTSALYAWQISDKDKRGGRRG